MRIDNVYIERTWRESLSLQVLVVRGDPELLSQVGWAMDNARPSITLMSFFSLTSGP